MKNYGYDSGPIISGIVRNETFSAAEVKARLERELMLMGAPPGLTVDFIYRGISILPDGGGRGDDRAQLRAELDLAKAKLREQDAYLEGLGNEPSAFATVAAKGSKPGRVVIRAGRGGELLEVTAPPGLLLVEGMTVHVLRKTMNVLGVVDAPPATGDVVTVRRVGVAGCEVAIGPTTRVVHAAPGTTSPRAGDRVLLDSTASVIVRNLGPEPPTQTFDGDTGVSWDDIGGQLEAKTVLREALEGPVHHAAIYQRYGKRPTKGVLLYGPPGNGKTMLGKAAATAIASLHGAASAASGYQYVKGPELLNMFVGESENNVRRLFESARRHKEAHGYPAIVFIDEAEALLSTRGAHGSGGMTSTVVPMFLAEMDGLVDSGAFILLATNRPDVLDPAVVREGRIDRKVRVGRPDRLDARAIFARALETKPLGASLEELADGAVGDLYDAAHALYRIQRSDGPPKTVALKDVTSGAQIVGIVEAATQLAIRRELASGETGIRAEDLSAAIAQTLEEQRNNDHRWELESIVEPFKAAVHQVERVRPVMPSRAAS